MNQLSKLLDGLYFTASHLAKSRLLRDYLAQTPDPDRGWVIAALAGQLTFPFFKRNTIKQLILERTDPVLFQLSYEYVGEMSETVAHLWPAEPDKSFVMPSVGEFVDTLQTAKKEEVEPYLIHLLNNFTPTQRWTLLKLGSGGLRVGLSARRLKQILAEYGYVDIAEIEKLWHGLAPPYTNLLEWLEGRADKPDITDKLVFHPVLLAHPLHSDDIAKLDFSQYLAEAKYDGIRVQVVVKQTDSILEKAMFSRTGDDISSAFPDVLERFSLPGVFDGELLAFKEGKISSFNDLQQRLNKKKPSKKLQTDYPCGLILYDVLSINETSTDQIGSTQITKTKSTKTKSTMRDLTLLPLHHRQQILTDTLAHSALANEPFVLQSEVFSVSDADQLAVLRETACNDPTGYIEGLMLKRKDSRYIAGRPKGVWYKYKRDAQLVDVVIMYAQRGHGKRSSFYSDFTFGLWVTELSTDGSTSVRLLPIGKAYSGFTDKELKELDKWVRQNTIGRFGPVKEVEKTLVFEVAFDAAHSSNRHKSGVALRFPRIHRIRWDKPAAEADQLVEFKRLHGIN